MKIAVLGDIHGNLAALEAVLNDLNTQKLDRIFCSGDLVGYGPHPNEVVQLIKAKEILTIMGNYDDAAAFNLPVCGCNFKSDAERQRGEISLSWTKAKLTAENKKFLQELPEELALSMGNRNLLFFHGSPRAMNEYLHDTSDLELYKDIIQDYPADIYIFGHTHIPYKKEIDGKLFINAGSVGFPKDGNPDACYVTVEFNSSVEVDFRRISYSAGQTARAIIEEGLPKEFADAVITGTPVKE